MRSPVLEAAIPLRKCADDSSGATVPAQLGLSGAGLKPCPKSLGGGGCPTHEESIAPMKVP